MYNPEKHKRHSIRLPNYDYSQYGLYFITICINNGLNLFGKIENYNMILNDAGKMIDSWYKRLENKFSCINCLEHIVMPNHVHFVLHNTHRQITNYQILNSNTGDHTGSPLRDVIGWFKTMTTNEYIRNVKINNWEQFDKKLWQRNYYEHVIRNEKSYEQIKRYIHDNPANNDESH